MREPSRVWCSHLRALVLVSLTGLWACYGTGGKTELFIKSSLDVNLGQPHRLDLDRSDLSPVADLVIELCRRRELTLVKQAGCTGTGKSCSLAFRGRSVDRRIFRGTQSNTMSYYSRYFVTLKRRGAKVRLEAIGAPVLGGEMACPPRLQTLTRCAAPALSRRHSENLTASVKREWGYDISGANEAETLQGLLAELRRTVSRGGTLARVSAVGSVKSDSQHPSSAAPAPTQNDRKTYERLRKEGKSCYRQRDYRCALERFASALERVPDPAMRFNLASAQDKLGLAALAVRNYRRYMKEAAGSVPGPALQHITRRMEALLRRVGRVQLKVVPADASLLLNGTAQPGSQTTRLGATTGWDLVLDPGSYQIELRRSGYLTRSRTVTVLAGEQRKLSLTLVPSP